MMAIDMKTVMFANVIVNFVGMVVMFILWYQNHNKYSGIAYWVLDWILLTGGTVLVVLQGSIPPWESMVLSNSMIVGGTVALYFGLRLFAGKKRNPLLISSILVVFAAFIVVHFYYTYVHFDLMVRNYNAAIGLLLACLLGMWLMLKEVSPQIRRISRGTGIAFGVIALICLVRVLGFSLTPQTSNQFLLSGKFDTLMVMLLVGASAFLVFNLVLMVNRRLYIETEEMENTLHRNVMELQAIFKTTSVGFGVLVNRVFKEANDACCQILGYPREELIGNETRMLYPTDQEYQAVEQAYQRVTELGSASTEARLLRKDGAIINTMLNLSAFDKNDLSKGVVFSILDITEYKLAEDALKESEARFHELYEDSPIGLYRTTPDGRISMVNTALIEMLGYSNFAELSERNLDSGAFEPSYPRNQFIDNIKKSGEIKGLEFLWTRKDGIKIQVRENARAVQDAKGNILYFDGSVENITERKQAEEALKASEEKYATLIEQSVDGILILQNRVAIFANRRMIELFGYSQDEILGKYFYQLAAPEYRGMLDDEYRRRQAGEKISGNHELEILAKDGKKIPVETKVQPIVYQEKPAVMVIIRDVTERKQAEEKIMASLVEKETLLKEVHHRVKNNMQVISSLLRLQEGRVKDKDSAALLRDSQNRIQSMSLVYNKLYQSQNLASIDTTDYIKELTAGIVKSYAVNPSRVTINVAPNNVLLDVDLAIPCGMVVNELVTNSLKYAFPDNRKGQISISLKEDDKGLELVVSDDGVGIPEGINPASTATLGIKLVTNLVRDQLGGEMELDRTHGTTFKITFRRTKEEK